MYWADLLSFGLCAALCTRTSDPCLSIPYPIQPYVHPSTHSGLCPCILWNKLRMAHYACLQALRKDKDPHGLSVFWDNGDIDVLYLEVVQLDVPWYSSKDSEDERSIRRC